MSPLDSSNHIQIAASTLHRNIEKKLRVKKWFWIYQNRRSSSWWNHKNMMKRWRCCRCLFYTNPREEVCKCLIFIRCVRMRKWPSYSDNLILLAKLRIIVIIINVELCPSVDWTVSEGRFHLLPSSCPTEGGTSTKWLLLIMDWSLLNWFN